MNSSNKKKIIGAAVGVAVVAIIAAIAIPTIKSSHKTQETSQTMEAENWEGAEYDYIGAANRYMGVVEAQDTVKIEKSGDKTIKAIFVKEGESVKKGSPLFCYDTEEIQLKLEQAELDLEGYDNEIKDLNNQIDTLEKERKAVDADHQFEYTSQIQEKQNAVARAEYNKKSKEIEINQIKESLNNSDVVSTIDGVIKSINQDNSNDNFSGEQEPFMTILSMDTYKIKGTINETNVWTIQEGMPVIIRSRVDQSQTWNGVITKVDVENPITNQNSMYVMDSNAEHSTNYPFYVEMDGSDGLILGQHVYIEMASEEEAF